MHTTIQGLVHAEFQVFCIQFVKEHRENGKTFLYSLLPCSCGKYCYKAGPFLTHALQKASAPFIVALSLYIIIPGLKRQVVGALSVI